VTLNALSAQSKVCSLWQCPIENLPTGNRTGLKMGRDVPGHKSQILEGPPERPPTGSDRYRDKERKPGFKTLHYATKKFV